MKRFILVCVVAIGAALLPHVASAAPFQFAYGSYSIKDGLNVSINAPARTPNPNGGYYPTLKNYETTVGEIELKGSYWTSSYGTTLRAFCIDVFDGLQSRGVMTETDRITNWGLMPRAVALDTQVKNEISALIANAYANIGSATKDKDGVLSAATQIAIWTVEYAGLGYTFTPDTGSRSKNKKVSAMVTALLTEFNGSKGVPGLSVISGLGNQSVAYLKKVPEPSALIVLGTVIAVFGFSYSRRRARGGLPA